MAVVPSALGAETVTILFESTATSYPLFGADSSLSSLIACSVAICVTLCLA